MEQPKILPAKWVASGFYWLVELGPVEFIRKYGSLTFWTISDRKKSDNMWVYHSLKIQNN